jgi:hypothetical protein
MSDYHAWCWATSQSAMDSAIFGSFGTPAPKCCQTDICWYCRHEWWPTGGWQSPFSNRQHAARCHDLLFSHIPKFIPITRRLRRHSPGYTSGCTYRLPSSTLSVSHPTSCSKPLDRPRPWSGYFTSIICNLDRISTRSHFNRDRISTMRLLFPTDSLVTGSHYYGLQYITLG